MEKNLNKISQNLWFYIKIFKSTKKSEIKSKFSELTYKIKSIIFFNNFGAILFIQFYKICLVEIKRKRKLKFSLPKTENTI